jgi:hypothetical protein
MAAKASEWSVRQENANVVGTEIDVLQGNARECKGGVARK